ncbi:hypothetical protein VTO73DRAFT_9005 [Trametes versicolor]
MSLPSSADAAQVVATYQGAATYLSCGIAVTALLLYDVLLTSGQEYCYVWISPKTRLSRFLYLCNRYMLLLSVILDLGTIPSSSDTMLVFNHSSHVLSDDRPPISCAFIVWLAVALNLLSLVGSATFTTLRIYALSRKNSILSGIALVLSMAPFVVNASTAYQQLARNLPAPLNCVQINTASRSLETG